MNLCVSLWITTVHVVFLIECYIFPNKWLSVDLKSLCVLNIKISVFLVLKYLCILGIKSLCILPSDNRFVIKCLSKLEICIRLKGTVVMVMNALYKYVKKIIFTRVAIIKKMCLVKYTSNHSTQKAMEESHVQSYGRTCTKILLCRNKACSCFSPTVYIYSKCHAWDNTHRNTKLYHLLPLRKLNILTFQPFGNSGFCL